MNQRVPVVERILGANDRLAADNRLRLDEAGVFSMNFLASPGAGKTSLVERTVAALAAEMRLAVIDGQATRSPLRMGAPFTTTSRMALRVGVTVG